MKAVRHAFVLAALFWISCLTAVWASPQSSTTPLKMMDPKADPAFAVASIKPSPSGPRGKGIRNVGRQLSGTNQTAIDLITYSYGVHRSLVSGGPPWLSSENFDVLAEPDGEGQPSDRQWKIMVQKLLASRFQLAFHHEKKEISVFVLTVAQGGPKIASSTAGPNGSPGVGFRLGNLTGRNAGMADLAWILQDALLDRPVLDRTGLTGRFDFTLNWTPDEFQFAARGIKPPPVTDPDKAPPDLYTAIREQLGLRLESTKAAADIILIDHVQEPTPN